MADGDPHALGAVYDRHSAGVYSHVLPLLGNPADAEEVVEETFWGAWRNARSYEPDVASVSSWIISIARRRAAERRKAKKSAPVRVRGKKQEPAVRGPAAIDKLPKDQREPLSLAFLGVMSYGEIAEELGTELEAVTDSVRAGMTAVGASLRPPPAEVPAAIEEEE